MLATARSGGRAILRVHDTGPGVPPELVPRLFTPFFTTKGPGQGTGLGLSVSYGLVEAHDGRISYRLAPEGGAELGLAAPPHYPRPFCRMRGSSRSWTAQPALSAADVGAPSRQSRVLVVDGDTAVHRLVSALFAPEGYVVDTARNGEQALRMVEDWVYDLVITDAHAVSADGRFFAATLLSSRPDWRDRLVVASHGRASEPFVTAAVHWVPKPLERARPPVGHRAHHPASNSHGGAGSSLGRQLTALRPDSRAAGLALSPGASRWVPLSPQKRPGLRNRGALEVEDGCREHPHGRRPRAPAPGARGSPHRPTR